MDDDGDVRVGMVVRDVDGKRLGKVRRCHPWGFEIVKGIFQPSEAVARYDEVVEIRDGAAVLARSGRDVFALAAGGLPPGWRARGWPLPSTPPEARRAELAAEERRRAPLRRRPAPEATISKGEEETYERTRGEAEIGHPAHP